MSDDKEELTRLRKLVLKLADELRQANIKHEAAYTWAKNNFAALESHMKACHEP